MGSKGAGEGSVLDKMKKKTMLNYVFSNDVHQSCFNVRNFKCHSHQLLYAIPKSVGSCTS